MTTPPFEDNDGEGPLLAELDRQAGARCLDCGTPLCGHLVLFSVALGLQGAPRCLTCLARGLDRDAAELRDQLGEYVWRRDCYRRAWTVAGAREGSERIQHPRCIWPLDGPEQARHETEEEEMEREAFAIADSWDAGDMGCGELVLALRGRLNALAPGDVLKVTARDPAAPEDLPAWCRLTGHRLLRATHPDYCIQRKER
jgi:tRNA 2-thiouridine synthesizing protein A